MASLAVRNLFQDKIRLTITLTGVIFAVVLVAIQTGLFLGFRKATSDIIDHSQADLWIGAKNVPYIEGGMVFSEQKRYQALATPGVASAEKYIVQFSSWKTPSGATEGVMIIGFNPDTGTGGPWNIVEGNAEDLKGPDAIFIDRVYRKKLGVTQLGQVVEINGHRARIVGFTQGIRSFTTMPPVFTSFKNAQNYSKYKVDKTSFVLVKAADADVPALKQRLLSRLQDVDVFTTEEFSRRTTNYWLFQTGAGTSVLIAAMLGLIVGIVVVAQTIYSATIDHLREYGTLKAIGASNGYLYRVILEQAAISASLGYAMGMVLALAVAQMTKNGAIYVVLPGPAVAAMFGLTLLMCVSASVVSINKVTKLDPAMVFKG